ncbi:hypothetical protein HDK90DRAFT_117649 [Phyllosticta capitalensis]|uniref:Uncharacterized protein n=1 Tax=Phyllosticta capitalensis TaxID=121624 RepID=A0ABR1Y9I2_9PEZI
MMFSSSSTKRQYGRHSWSGMELLIRTPPRDTFASAPSLRAEPLSPSAYEPLYNHSLPPQQPLRSPKLAMPHQNYYYPQQGQMPQVPSLSQQLQQIQMEQQSPQAQRFQQSPQAQRYQQAQPLPHQPHQMQGQQSQQLHGPQDQVQAQPQTQSLNGPNGAMNGSHGAMDGSNGAMNGTHGTMNGSNGVMAVAQPGLPETPQEPRLMFPNGTPHVVKCGACGFEMRPEMTFLEWLNHCAHGRNYGDDELDYDICVCDVAFMTAKDMQEHQQEYGCKMRR